MSRSMKIDGVRVVDAKQALKLSISPNDVKLGKKRDPDACAAALACTRQIGGASAAKVYRSKTYVKIGTGKKARWIRFRTPESIKVEMVSFDRGSSFEPGEYTLSPIAPSQRLGAPRSESRAKTGPHAGKRAPAHITAKIRAVSPYRNTLDKHAR